MAGCPPRGRFWYSDRVLTAASWLLWTGALLAAPAFDHEHKVFNQVLQGYVTGGRVAYTAMRDGPGERELDAYLATLQQVTRAQYGAFTNPQKLAFWINAYNAHAIKAVLKQWPTASLKDARFYAARTIPLKLESDADVSLDDIEDVIVRKFKEPRAYLALAPGARGLPRLRNTAYRADALEAQLDDAASRAVASDLQVKLDLGKRALALGEPFRRHQADFEARAPHLAAFVAPYLDVDAYDAIKKGPPPRVTWLPVDYEPSGY